MRILISCSRWLKEEQQEFQDHLVQGKPLLSNFLAKYSDAQIVVYIGCGERENEMTEVLDEFYTLSIQIQVNLS